MEFLPHHQTTPDRPSSHCFLFFLTLHPIRIIKCYFIPFIRLISAIFASCCVFNDYYSFRFCCCEMPLPKQKCRSFGIFLFFPSRHSPHISIAKWHRVANKKKCLRRTIKIITIIIMASTGTVSGEGVHTMAKARKEV